jgi:hypothetical protein
VKPAASLPRSAVTAEQEEPSPSPKGEGHGRHQRSWSGCPGTSRRRGLGTARRLSSELERSVSTPARTRPEVASLRCPAATTSITSDPGKRRSVERKSEEAVVVMTTGTTQPGSSEGPLARCAKRPATTVGLPTGLFTHLPLGARSTDWEGRSGRPPTLVARRNAGRSTAWGKAVCGRTARTVWEGGTGEVDAQARWNTHPKGNRRD